MRHLRDHRIFTLGDFHAHAEDLGLEVVSVDTPGIGRVVAVVKEGPPSEVIRRPPVGERFATLQDRLENGHAIGIAWEVSLQPAAGSSLRRMKMSTGQIVLVATAITLTVGAFIGILVYGLANL